MNDFVIYTDQDYKKALKEVFIILHYIPKVDLKKIPEDILKIISLNADLSYDFKINKDLSIKEQNISELTKAFLEILYREYWITDVEKRIIRQEEKKQEIELEKKKMEKYNPDFLFNNTKENNFLKKEEKALIEVKNESLLTKIILFFSRLFNH